MDWIDETDSLVSLWYSNEFMLCSCMNEPNSREKSTAPPANISIHNESEIKKWMAHFQCPREDLLYAVNKIGSSTFKVEAYLKRQHG